MRPYAALGVMVLIAVGCSPNKKPAQAALRSAANAVNVALSPDADKFAPREVTELQTKLANLSASYELGNYTAVIDSASGVTATANELMQMVSIDERRESQQRAELGRYDIFLPTLLSAVWSRIDELDRTSHPLKHTNLSAAREQLNEAEGQWEQAKGDRARGQLAQALNASRQAESIAKAAAAALDLQWLAGR